MSKKFGGAVRIRRIAIGVAALLAGVLIGVVLISFIGGRDGDVGRTAFAPDDPPTTTTEAPEVPAEEEEVGPSDAASPREPLRTVVVADWEAGRAASLACNLVSEPDFEGSELPSNFFLDPLNEDREVIVFGAGFAGTGALEIGDPGVAGVFGEIIPVESGRQYIVSLNSRIVGEVAAADVRLDWVNDQFIVVSSSASLDLVDRPAGQYALVTDGAPPEAGYGVARISKDDGSGLLYVDEIVVTRSDAECADLFLG